MKIRAALIGVVSFLGIFTCVAGAQTKEETRNVVVNGRSGQVQVLQSNGREYIDIAAVVHVAQGSIVVAGPAWRARHDGRTPAGARTLR